MKKLVAISVAAAMLLGLASVAMASTTDWTLLMRGSATDYTYYSGTCQFGLKTGALDAKDANDTKYTANTGAQAQVASYEPTFGDTPPLYSKDMKAPTSFATNGVTTWDLAFWVGTGYTKDVARLAVWSTSTLTPALPAGYAITLNVVNDPTGTYAAGKSWEIPAGILGTSAAPTFFVDFNNIQNTLKLADASAGASGVQLQLKVAPTAVPPVPEPSSVLALASGLVGMAGFAIRRRK